MPSVEMDIPTTEERVFALCDHALGLAPPQLLPDLPASKEAFGTIPQWHAFESEAWPIGEHIRLGLVQHCKMRKLTVFMKIAEVAQCKNLRRGRQSFIMAMGYVPARDCAPGLIPLLSDPDVDGHVLHTLLKMKATCYRTDVEPLLKSQKAWIRRLAKKYLAYR